MTDSASERSIRELEATFREAPVGLALVGADGRWLRVNEQCSIITGYSQAELISGTFQDITHPDDLEADLALLNTLLAGEADRYTLEKRYLRKGGGEVWVNLTVTAIRDKDGRPDFFISVIEDISERREVAAGLSESEARYRAIFDSAVEAIAVIDERGTMQSVNPACERIFGYAPAELIGQNVRMLMPGPVATEHDGYLRRYAETGERAIIGIGREVLGRRKDGTVVPLDLSVAEWSDQGQRFFTGIMRDITPRREAESALRSSEDRLRALQNDYAHLARVNELGEMAAAIAHEINQPLTAIVNFLNAGRYLLESDRPKAKLEAGDVMTQAAAQALRAGDIVRRLREFVGKSSGERRVERIATLMDSASGLALIDASARGISVDRSDVGDVEVHVDPVQMQQVLVNLIRNAVDALGTLPPGRKRLLTLETRPLPGNKEVEIRIADSGPGVPPEILPTLFDPFVTTKPQGMGMGLSVCRRLVEAQGGSIELERSQIGASFRLTLPIVDPS